MFIFSHLVFVMKMEQKNEKRLEIEFALKYRTRSKDRRLAKSDEKKSINWIFVVVKFSLENPRIHTLHCEALLHAKGLNYPSSCTLPTNTSFI